MPLTKAEKRIEIAKDVLKQIKSNKYRPTSGIWVMDSNGYEVEDLVSYARQVAEEADAVDLKKDVVCRLNGTCSVCALGSLFVSAIDKFNHTKLNPGYRVNWIDSEDSESNPLLKWFSAKQLLLIESTFEGGHGGWANEAMYILSKKELLHWNKYAFPAIYAYCNRYPNATSRLKAIMNNIIRNKGTFVLPGVKL